MKDGSGELRVRFINQTGASASSASCRGGRIGRTSECCSQRKPALRALLRRPVPSLDFYVGLDCPFGFIIGWWHAQRWSLRPRS
jgi:hypothetical protein